MTPEIEMKHLTNLKVNLLEVDPSDNHIFCSYLCKAIIEMLVLSHLYVCDDWEDIFCQYYLQRIIEIIIAQNNYVVIESLKYAFDYCQRKVEIYRRVEDKSNVSCFKMLLSICLDNFLEFIDNTWLKDFNKFSNYVIFKKGLFGLN